MAARATTATTDRALSPAVAAAPTHGKEPSPDGNTGYHSPRDSGDVKMVFEAATVAANLSGMSSSPPGTRLVHRSRP